MGDLYAMLQRAVFVALFMLLVVRAQGDVGRDGLDVRDGAQTKLNEVIYGHGHGHGHGTRRR